MTTAVALGLAAGLALLVRARRRLRFGWIFVPKRPRRPGAFAGNPWGAALTGRRT